MKQTKDRLSRVMIIGATPSGIFAANKLGELGVPLTLVDSEPDLDRKLSGDEYRLKSGIPFNHAHRPGLIRILRNPSIRTILPATVDSIKHNIQGFMVKLIRHQTFMDPDRCTLCGNCIGACPVRVGQDKKVVSVHSRQSLPGRPVIDKRSRPLCSLDCPLGVNVQGYMALTKEGKYKEALKLIREKNILPAICGRVCTHPCEVRCRRNELEGAVAIRSVKRFLADAESDRKAKIPEIATNPDNKRFAVIGSGPAGLAAAHALAEKGFKVTLFEKEKMAGGLLRYGIGPHRLPRKILDRELKVIKQSGVKIKTSHPIDLAGGLKTLKNKFDGIIIASGASKDRKLGIPGEELGGVEGAISFLKRYYNGEVKKIKKAVAVIGDGNAAFDLARVLRRVGSEVTLISWFGKQKIPANRQALDGAVNEGVTIIDNTSVVEFEGKNNKVSSLKCKATKPGDKPDKNGTIWPVIIEKNAVKKLEFEQVFVAIGQTGALARWPEDNGIFVNNYGYIETRDFGTGMAAVFAAGDVVTGPSSVVHAMAQGRAAANKALQEICGIRINSDQKSLRPADREFEPVPGDTPKKQVSLMPMITPETLTDNFTEIAAGFSEEQTLDEAGRCLQCGSCSECLICMDVCGAKAVNHLEPEEEIIEHTGVLILADPEMISHPVKGGDIIRVYRPRTTRPDVYAMILRGFAAAAQAMILLKNSSRRRKGRDLPFTTPDTAFIAQEIRIGIFVCKCNSALGWDNCLDDYLCNIREQKRVGHVGTLDSACVKEGISAIIKTVRSHSINRIVLASCVCCPLDVICTSCTDQRSRLKEGLFTATGISRSMVETCNIRGEALDLMTKDKKLAVARFKGLISRSVKRAQRLKPFATPARDYNFTIGVIGESDASVTSAMMLAQTGAEVLLFGAGKNPLSNPLNHPNIQAFEGSLVKHMTGNLGNFQITANIESHTQIFHVGAVILEHRLIRQIKFIHQEGLPDRRVLTAMQGKNITGIPFILPGMTSMAGLFLSDPPGINVSSRQKGAAAAIHAAAIMPRRPRQSRGYTVLVNPSLCRGCGRCIDVCSYQAITMNENLTGGWAASVDEAFCKGCGNCIAVCPTNAVDSPFKDHVFFEHELEEILV